MQAIIMSTCIKKEKEQSYIFHFKGFYMGVEIRKIFINSNIELESGEEYILKVHNIYIEKNVLIGQCVKAKKLFSF